MKYGFACAVGDIPSSKGFPSLATVCERLRVMCGRNLDCRNEDLESFFGAEEPSSECFRSLPSLLPLFIRKKFLIFCDTWLFEPLICLFDDRGRPEKVLFSVRAELLDEELKSWVMKKDEERLQGVWPDTGYSTHSIRQKESTKVM